MAQQTLNAGSPPIVWSTVEDAFTKINANFDELYGSIGGPGGVLDFTSLSTDIKPSASEVYDLGSPTFRWRDLYLSGSSLYLGSAQITADGAGILNLPLGTTVNGELIINPSETAFKTITVSGQSNIVADSFEDTLTVASGTGIALTTNAGTDTLTIANSGVTGLTGTAGQIGVSAATGSVTLTNLGVTSLTGTAGGIGVSAASGGVTLTNLGVKQIVGTASQIGVTGDGTGIVTITNLAPASPTFRFIVVDGATLQPVSADNISDTLNLISGAGLTITKDTATDTLTFSVNSNLDIRGSVFADDSTMLVDATDGVLRGTLIGTVVGDLKGSVFGDDSTVIVNAIDRVVTAAGGFIGNLTGTANTATTVTVVATNATAATHYITFVDTATGDENVRTDTDLTYNPNTNTLTAGTLATGSLSITGSTIGTIDSSGIVINELTTFNTDVTFENDITVTGQVTIGGELVVNGTGIAAASFTGAAAAATTASTAASVGYLGVPQSATSTTATLVIGDIGKHIYVNTAGQTITIPANSSVAYPIGTAISFVAGPSATTVLLAITSDTMYLAGTGTTGTRTLAAHGMATAIKVSATEWYINGTGLT